ncbi:hypothetical protein A9Q84_01010 [Halobacteriovorax marinus]|uniref:Uncharacterized protein n=1 Tax=Halobacteriovorax marinus TaxID=97084 RepID=A0A1Y5FBR5_9BACT|nr:hypothetical protein A9Q84_01010 [Halobacteriovorax marinus]
MSNALVIIKDKWLSNVFAINLSFYAGVNCILKYGEHDLNGIEDISDIIDLIIVEEWLGDTNSYVLLKGLLGEDRLKEIPMIFIRPEEREQAHRFGRHLNYETLDSISISELLKSTSKSLDISAADMNSRPVPSKFPIDLKFFNVFKNSPFQVFTKHRLDSKEAVYELCFDKGEEITDAILLKLKKTHTRKLYILSSERLKFANCYTVSAFEAFESEQDDGSKLDFLQLGRESIFTHLNDGGDIEEIADMADKSILEVMKEADKINLVNFTSYLESLLAKSDSYFLQHALLSTYISFLLLNKLGWNSLSQKKTFSSAAFFQNILFDLHQERIAKIRSDEELEEMFKANDIDKEEYFLVQKHALKTSSLMSDTQISFFPENTHTIIREHHGNRKGIGFIRDPEKSLHPMSLIFLLANDYADTVLLDKVADHDEILKILSKKFISFQKYNNFIQLISENEEDNYMLNVS